MRRTIKVLFSLALVLACVTEARSDVITFDATGPAILPNQVSPFNSTFSEAGYHVEAFWQAGGGHVGGHYHLGTPSVSGVAEQQHWNGSDQLQGFYITRNDGGVFDLNSLEYLVRDTTAINGFPAGNAHVLISTSYNPALPAAGQFVSFPVGPVGGSFSTLNITGFDNITGVYITSSASVSFDDITINAAVPEPMSMAIFGGLAVAGIAGVRRRMKKA